MGEGRRSCKVVVGGWGRMGVSWSVLVYVYVCVCGGGVLPFIKGL